MILIWGWKVRFKTLLEGLFFCPTCGGDRQYHQRQGRRWFTFFFLPVIPLNNVGEPFVECTTCKQAYRMSVLQTPTSSDLTAHLLGAVREALVAMFRQAPPTPPSVRVALEVLSLNANQPWSEANLHHDIQTLDVNGLQARLAALATALNEHGKERLIADLARVAAADGPIIPPERQLLDFVAGSLGMTAAHAHGVISQIGQHAV